MMMMMMMIDDDDDDDDEKCKAMRPKTLLLEGLPSHIHTFRPLIFLHQREGLTGAQ